LFATTTYGVLVYLEKYPGCESNTNQVVSNIISLHMSNQSTYRKINSLCGCNNTFLFGLEEQ
jgi:hypothetical protein